MQNHLSSGVVFEKYIDETKQDLFFPKQDLCKHPLAAVSGKPKLKDSNLSIAIKTYWQTADKQMVIKSRRYLIFKHDCFIYIV